MKRSIIRKPGYDCIYAPCKVKPEKPCVPGTGSSHGISSDEIWYVVSDEDIRGCRWALVVNIGTNVYPSTIPKEHFARAPKLHEQPARFWGVYLHRQLPRTGNERIDASVCEFINASCESERLPSIDRWGFESYLCMPDIDLNDPGERFWTDIEAEFITQLKGFTDETAHRKNLGLFSSNAPLVEWLLARRKAYEQEFIDWDEGLRLACHDGTDVNALLAYADKRPR